MEAPLAILLCILVAIGGVLSPWASLRWLVGLFAGAFGLMFGMEALNDHFHFRQGRGDMDMTPLVDLAIGGFLGSASGLGILLCKRDNRLIIGILCLLTALPGLALFAAWFWDGLHEYHTPPYYHLEMLAEVGPGLLWSSWLLLRAVWLIRQGMMRPA